MHKVKALASRCQCAGSSEHSLIPSTQKGMRSFEMELDFSFLSGLYIQLHLVYALTVGPGESVPMHRLA